MSLTDITVHPWNGPEAADGRLPKEAVLACVCDVHIIVDTMWEEVWFHRTPDRDELWLRQEYGDGPRLAASAPTEGIPAPACLRLFKALILARTGHEWPTRFCSPGLITELDFDTLLQNVKADLDRNAKLAQARETPIVQTARDLKLYPEPTGDSPDHWQARCPETNHPLFIHAGSGTFGCGWCGRKGGPDELRKFVLQRNEKFNTRH